MVDDKSSKEKDSKEKDFKANATLIGKVASISASASGSSSRSSSSRGKGKERERGDSVNASSGGGGQTRNEDDGADGRESFLPTYVYDAMKVKKRFEHRFEHMRVSVFSCFVPFLSSFFVLHSSFVPSCCIPPVYSMLISL